MKRIADFLVEKRFMITTVMLLITLVFVLMIPCTNVITDLTGYLPDDSKMKQGVDLMKTNFPGMAMSGSIRIMGTGLSDEEKEEVLEALKQIPEGSLVSYQAASDGYNRGEYTLYELTVLYDYHTPEMDSVKKQLNELTGRYPVIYQTGEDQTGYIPPWILLLAVSLLFAILFLMCRSFAEPFLFLITIGCAIGINNGSNALLPSVSNVTNSIAAILQLALSMDYSIILINRYREECKLETDKKEAMKRAITGAISAIASSSLTTVVGLLALVFMSFRIGADIGIVLAKGVFISMICILTILPSLILKFDGLIAKTEKKVIPLPTDWLADFSYRSRNVMAVLIFLLFGIAFYFKGNALITYTLFAPNPIDDVFGPSNPVVLLYENGDEDKIDGFLKEFEEDEQIRKVNCYASTLGKQFTSDEMMTYIAELGFGDEIEQYSGVLPLLFAGKETMSPEELFAQALTMADNPLFSAVISEEIREQLSSAAEQLESGKNSLIGANHSILMFDTAYPPESAQTNAFLERIRDYTDEHFDSQTYMIGNSPMQFETAGTFRDELNKISLITAAAIFTVVFITFRNLGIPAILILLIQTAVYLTMLFMGIIGSGIYYLALLIVQSILMGATIDYAILYVSLYREARETLSVKDAMIDSYRKAIHTIMTSGLIIVLVTWIVGYAFADPSIQQICHIITIGSVMALTLILVVLPGAVAGLDKIVVKHGNN